MRRLILHNEHYNRDGQLFKFIVYERKRFQEVELFTISSSKPPDGYSAVFILFNKLFPMAITISYEEMWAAKKLDRIGQPYLLDIVDRINKMKRLDPYTFKYALTDKDRKEIIYRLVVNVPFEDPFYKLPHRHRELYTLELQYYQKPMDLDLELFYVPAMISAVISETAYEIRFNDDDKYIVLQSLFPQLFEIPISNEELVALQAINYFYSQGVKLLMS